MFVHAGNRDVFLAAGGEELLAPADAEFFKRFEAIGDERRADDRELLDSRFGKALELKIRIGLQPRVAPEARLKRNRILARGNPRPGDESRRRRKNLRAVARRARRRGALAAVATIGSSDLRAKRGNARRSGRISSHAARGCRDN